MLLPFSVTRILPLKLQVIDNGFLTNKSLFLKTKKIKVSNYFIWKCVLIILPIKYVFINTSYQSITEHNDCLWVYMYLFSIIGQRGGFSSRTLSTVFLQCESFYFQREKQFVATLTYQEFSILVSLLLRRSFWICCLPGISHPIKGSCFWEWCKLSHFQRFFKRMLPWISLNFWKV